MRTKVRRRLVVEAPASSANLGSGFDVFAVALERPRDRLTLERSQSGISITARGVDRVSDVPAENVAGAVAGAVMSDHDVKAGISMLLRKGVPVGAGLGSSAASSVAAAVGTSALFGLNLQPREIIRYAGIGERLASGMAHYDNVTASYAGGFVIVTKDLEYAKMAAPRSLALCLITPEVELPEQKTMYARSLLPKTVALERMVDVTRASSLMVHGFATGNLEEIGKGMAESPVDESRSGMIPKFEEVKRAAIAHGASGVCISGAGPTMLAVCRRHQGPRVLGAMMRTFGSAKIESSGFLTGVGGGCKIVEEE